MKNLLSNTKVSKIPLGCCGMDIAETTNGYKLIECNCFNGTGFYRHNIEKIIKAINTCIHKKLATNIS